MAKLHYHRWLEQFSIDEFSSEDSMRDYLSSNPTLFFEEDTWVIPIKEEKCLPESSLVPKQSGRADIILCRLLSDMEDVKQNGKLSSSDIELWVVELKKDEASYENGFRQLFDYLTIIKNDEEIRDDIRSEILKKSKEKLNVDKLEFRDAELNICGGLVAPSFDLFYRSKESVNKNIREKYKYDWQELDKNLKEKDKEGFTLIDAVYAATKLFSSISLIKLIRFKRSDEIIIYAENILGKRAVAQISGPRVDPIELFTKNIVKENEVFFFKDDKGMIRKDVECKILKKRGPSKSFIVRIEKIEGHEKIDIPRWAKNHYKYRPEKIPIEETSKSCSIALHRLLTDYKNNENDLFKKYWTFGDKNFIRESDEKSLEELRVDSRLVK